MPEALRGDRLELAADAVRCLGLEVQHVLRGRAALQVQEDDAFGRAGRDLLGGIFQCQECRRIEETAEQRECPRLERASRRVGP